MNMDDCASQSTRSEISYSSPPTKDEDEFKFEFHTKDAFHKWNNEGILQVTLPNAKSSVAFTEEGHYTINLQSF